MLLFTEIAQRAAKRMKNGGSLLTLTYGGSTRVMPNYNVMGVAKAALEASVRYLATDLGPDGIRVNALSAGRCGRWRARASRCAADVQPPARPRAPAADGDAGRGGGSALYLLSSLSGVSRGETHFVDSGYNIISMPRPDVLQAQDEAASSADA